MKLHSGCAECMEMLDVCHFLLFSHYRDIQDNKVTMSFGGVISQRISTGLTRNHATPHG